jgi:hypothetical protein
LSNCFSDRATDVRDVIGVVVGALVLILAGILLEIED